MACSNGIESSMLTSVVECESDRVCCELVASLETLFEVFADVVPDLWTAVGILRRLFRLSRRFFRLSRRFLRLSRRLFRLSRRVFGPKAKPG